MARKIATCCYCSTRAVLVFDKKRHELSCSACGAPLQEMKMMPIGRERTRPIRTAPPRQQLFQRKRQKVEKYHKPRRRKKSFARWAAEELWDVVEDIFD